MNTSLNQAIATVALSIALATGVVNFIGGDLQDRAEEAAGIIDGTSHTRTTDSYDIDAADIEWGY